MRFNPATSILEGVPTATLQAELAALQLAWYQLSLGEKVEVAGYTQGDGAKSITYTRANMATLVQAIRLLQAQLGIIRRPRSAMRPWF